MHFLASWGPRYRFNIISISISYSFVSFFRGFAFLTGVYVEYSLQNRFVFSISLFGLFATESMRITWGQWLRTPGTEKNKCSSHCGKSLICITCKILLTPQVKVALVHMSNSPCNLLQYKHQIWRDLCCIWYHLTLFHIP